MFRVTTGFIEAVRERHRERIEKNEYQNKFGYRVGSYQALHDDLLHFAHNELQSINKEFYDTLKKKEKKSDRDELMAARTLQRALSPNQELTASDWLVNLLGYFLHGKEWAIKKSSYSWNVSIKDKQSSAGTILIPEEVFHPAYQSFKNQNSPDINEGLKWMKRNWSKYQSGSLLVESMKLYDILAKPLEGLDQFEKGIISLKNYNFTSLEESAIRYYKGRFLIQKGDYSDALTIQSKNSKGNDLYSLLSQFEKAQLLFRIENFAASLKDFEDLRPKFPRHPQLLNKRIHIDLYIGTLHAIQIIYSSIPYAQSHREVPCNASGCAKMASESEKLTQFLEDNLFKNDLGAWNLFVKAFSKECIGELKLADAHYQEGLKQVLSKPSLNSSKVHLSLYYARFLRTFNKKKAAEILNNAKHLIADTGRAKDEARLHEEEAYIHWDTNRKASKDHMTKAMAHYHREQNFTMWDDWPIVKRLRNSCNELGITFHRNRK